MYIISTLPKTSLCPPEKSQLLNSSKTIYSCFKTNKHVYGSQASILQMTSQATSDWNI
uniref:Uncharacterized protein n=1 Tax=Setaria italica TaxID=4555 RepID=K4A495_SETIT